MYHSAFCGLGLAQVEEWIADMWDWLGIAVIEDEEARSDILPDNLNIRLKFATADQMPLHDMVHSRWLLCSETFSAMAGEQCASD